MPPVKGGRPSWWGVCRARRVARRAVSGSPSVGDADGRGALPVGLSVAGGEGGGGADADEGVPGPGAAVLRGLQQEGAGAFGGELAVEPDRGVPVGEELAGDRNDAAVGGQLAERLEVHGG
ncbi:hypothetical protein GCM10020256_58320 [Streptomyces thermocoprophilus]